MGKTLGGEVLLVKRLVVGPLGTNCYVVASAPGAGAAIIDPGGDADAILAEVADNDLRVVYVVNTHGHSDHVAANASVLEATGARLVIHELDAPMLGDPVANISAFIGARTISPEADVTVTDGDTVDIDGFALSVLHTPGHTPGSICLLGHETLFSGDTLFAGSVGRTDLPGGSSRQMADSLAAKIAVLDNGVIVYSGHGESTTIGREKMINPFLRGEPT